MGIERPLELAQFVADQFAAGNGFGVALALAGELRVAFVPGGSGIASTSFPGFR
jgi:hypothetical protein